MSCKDCTNIGCHGTPVVAGVKPAVSYAEAERAEREVLYDLLLRMDACGVPCSDCDLGEDADGCVRYQKARFSESLPKHGFHLFLCYPVSEQPSEVGNYLCYVGEFGCELKNQYVVLYWDGSHWLMHKDSMYYVSPVFWGHLPPKPKGV